MPDIPLLRFPITVMRLVFAILTPIEILVLSQTSKKVAKIIPTVCQFRLEIALEFGTRTGHISLTTGEMIYEIQLQRPQPRILKVLSKPLEEHHPNPGAGESLLSWDGSYGDLTIHVLKSFNAPVTTFHIGTSLYAQEYRAIGDWMLENAPKVDYISLRTLGLSGRDVQNIFNNLQNTSKIFIWSEIASPFMLNPLHHPESLTCLDCSWLTVENLMKLESETIEIMGATLSNENIQTCLQYWKSGGFSNLKRLHVRSKNFNMTDPILGMNPPIWNETSFPNFPLGIDGGVEIERNDGTKAFFAFMDLGPMILCELYVPS